MRDFWHFLNTNFFLAIITLIVGLVAYWLYRKRQKDFKKDAANILLLEIQNAERLLRVAKERMQQEGVIVDNAYVMSTESWSKYKYMFVRDFDRDGWDTVNSFFDKCALFDAAVSHKSAAFKNNEAEIRTNMQRITADYIKELIDSNDPAQKEELIGKIDQFQNEYLALRADLVQYQPNKPLIDAKALLESINDGLSQTTVGITLKKLAGLKSKDG